MIYQVKRPAKRRVFYIDVGNMPAKKVKEYLDEVKYQITGKKPKKEPKLVYYLNNLLGGMHF